MCTCPNCGANLAQGKTLGLRVKAKVESNKVIEAMPKCYICPRCGFVSLYVDKKKLDKQV